MIGAIAFHAMPTTEEAQQTAIYVRSAYRNDPEFMLRQLEQVGPAAREHRLSRLIDNDAAVSTNYRRLVSQGFADVFERAPPEQTIAEFREQYIGPIREAMKRLFPDLILNSLGNPLSEGTFRFDKGESKAFQYKNLSGGEKAAFDLLLDILIKRREFDDSVFLIDEPEAHMSHGLQSTLLRELLAAIPSNSQLWLATHSIGMMREARNQLQSNPGTVVFLDFDGVDFDLPAILRPIEPSRPFWKRAMQIALDDLAGFVTPEHVVLCEGGSREGGSNFDADCYNRIFQTERPQTLFLGAGNSDDVCNDPRGVQRLLSGLAPGVTISRAIDRDDSTEDEIRTRQSQGIRVLTLRNIESYLLDDSILRAICESFGHPERAIDLIAAKSTAIASSVQSGGPTDDIKRAAGDIYNAAKRLLPEHKLGSDRRAFMREICSQHIKPGSPIYDRLKRDIFG
jgi:hypothetical protein